MEFLDNISNCFRVLIICDFNTFSYTYSKYLYEFLCTYLDNSYDKKIISGKISYTTKLPDKWLMYSNNNLEKILSYQSDLIFKVDSNGDIITVKTRFVQDYKKYNIKDIKIFHRKIKITKLLSEIKK